MLQELGEKAIIGGTANTLEDVIALIDDVDYIGLGPFKFTETKTHLSPILKLNGYEKIINQLKTICAVKGLPIIAIGGINLKDIEPLLATGIYGIAVSGLLTHNFELTAILKEKINDKEK